MPEPTYSAMQQLIAERMASLSLATWGELADRVREHGTASRSLVRLWWLGESPPQPADWYALARGLDCPLSAIAAADQADRLARAATVQS